MKKIGGIIWWLLCIAFLLVCIFCITQKQFVKKYNQGNEYYNEKEYDMAQSCFQEALEKHPLFKRDCAARINLALSMTTPLSPDQINTENADETIEKLEKARDILLEHGWADDSYETAKSIKAQELKEDIERYIEEIKNAKGQEAQDSPDNQNNEPDDPKEEDPKQKELQDNILEIQKRSIKDRDEQLGNNTMFSDYDYYSGDCW